MWFSKAVPKKFSTQLIIMTIVAGLIPVGVIVGLLTLLVNQLPSQIGTAIIQKQEEQWQRSRPSLMQMMEDRVRQKALDVALQLDLYLQAHPEMTVKNLQNDGKFKEIAVQPLGERGYTAVIDSDTLTFRFHKNPEMVNFISSSKSDRLKDALPILKSSRRGKYAYGYYRWIEQDGSSQDMFMYIAPIYEKTTDRARLSVVAAIYVDEFTRPFQTAQDVSFATTQYLIHAVKQTIQSLRLTGFILVAFGILLISLLSYWIGIYFSRIIIKLREATKSVNQGNFDTRIEYSDTGELGELITDFNQMVSQLQKTTVSRDRLEASEKKLVEVNVELTKEVNERKQAELKYRSIFYNAMEGIYQTTPGGQVLTANPAMSTILGYDSPDDLIKSIKNLSTDLYTEPARRNELIKLMEEQGYVKDFEFKAYRKDKTIVDVSINAQVVHDVNGDVLYYEGMLIDLSERKKLESRLVQSQKMQAIGTLAGGIAHDFNNILTAISGYTDLTYEKFPEGSPIRNNMEQVLKACSRAKDLVKQILTFSRQMEQERRPMHVVPIIKEALKLLRSSLPSTVEIRIDVAISPEADVVLADPTQIHQVLMNLCTNAAHAMRDKGGILSVGLSEFEADSHFSLRHPDVKPGRYVRLTVGDTGHGMDEAVLKRIFEPYFTTKGLGKGTGMGLAVVQGIVASHGGAIIVYSEPGAGSTFHLFFPLIEEEIAPEAAAIKPYLTGNERILFVDDESTLVDLGKEILESRGYNVTTKTNSLEALEAFRLRPAEFDLIITDMTMPGMTGINLAEELLRIRPGIPIILCTGFSDLLNENKLNELGIKSLVMKPFTGRELTEIVRRVLDGNANPDYS